MIVRDVYFRNVYACGALGYPQPSRSWCDYYSDPSRKRVGVLRIILK